MDARGVCRLLYKLSDPSYDIDYFKDELTLKDTNVGIVATISIVTWNVLYSIPNDRFVIAEDLEDFKQLVNWVIELLRTDVEGEE